MLVSALFAIRLLYGAGLMWGQHTNIAIMEYWRWWVVHLWVEGIFEVFATAIISLLFVQMGHPANLHRHRDGVVRDDHLPVRRGARDLPSPVFQRHANVGDCGRRDDLGARSGAAAGCRLRKPYTRRKVEHEAEWERIYHWPVMFFAAVLFWIWSAPGCSASSSIRRSRSITCRGEHDGEHGHAALFGVYGMLGLGLTLYCMRGLTGVTRWNQKWIRISFWSLNIGLGMMTFLSLLPQGHPADLRQHEHGYAYARSAEFIHSPIMQALV